MAPTFFGRQLEVDFYEKLSHPRVRDRIPLNGMNSADYSGARMEHMDNDDG